jgi:hypothetical protein
MVIPEGIQSGHAYRDFYRMLGQVPGPKLMLDNGAFEAEGPQGQLSFEKLMEYMAEYHVDEFVLPDVMGDARKTLNATRNFLHRWEMAKGESLGHWTPQFLVVAQGADKPNLYGCIEGFWMMEDEFETEFVYCLPKWISQEMESDIRMQLAGYIGRNYQRKVHLLGLSRAWPQEIRFAAQTYPHIVRSIDTAAPFVYAINGHDLSTVSESERPEHYFNHDSRLIDEHLLANNLSVLGWWANGA